VGGGTTFSVMVKSCFDHLDFSGYGYIFFASNLLFGPIQTSQPLGLEITVFYYYCCCLQLLHSAGIEFILWFWLEQC
jgi:hypothetical protein